VKKAERDAHLRQGVVLPETPTQRRERAELEEDLRSIPLRGRPLPLRLRNFRSSAEAYLASAGGPLPYMLRLRLIEDRIAEQKAAIADAWRSLAEECDGNARRFSARWRAAAGRWSFDEVNDLIDRHNRWYPIESQLPMDPRSGTYVLVNGRDYRLSPLDVAWILDRFPPSLSRVPAAVP
jgi:hypothetical protein